MGAPLSHTVRVMVVDDDPMVGRSLGRMLKALGCLFEVHVHPATALHRLEHNPFDVVLVDLMMPGMDGLQFIRAVGTLETKVPMVLMSGRARPRDIVEAHRLGAMDCLLKPFDERELEAALARALFRDVAPAATSGGPTEETPPGLPKPAAAPVTPPSAGEPDLAHRVLARVRTGPIQLPIPPVLLSRLAQLDESETAAEDEVIAALESSAVLTAEVIRAARTADVSRASAPPRNLSEAILRLGTSRALRHAQTAAHLCIGHDLLDGHPELVSALWVHHLLSSRAAEYLARALCPQVVPGLHGLCLFMELGELFALRALVDLAPEMLLPGADPAPVRALLTAVHGEAGQIALSRLDLPRVYGEIALAHTNPAPVGGPATPALLTLLVLRSGRALAAKVSPGCPQSAPHVLTAAERAALPGLDAALLQQAARYALEEVKGTLGLTQGSEAGGADQRRGR